MPALRPLPKNAASRPAPARVRQRPDPLDEEELAFEAEVNAIPLGEFKPVDVRIAPELVRALRARRPPLKSLTLRVGADQIEEARRVAKEIGKPYQTVLRGWLAMGARRTRNARAARR